MPNDVDKKALFSDFEPVTREQWLDKAIASLKGAPFEKKTITKLYEGIDLQPMYWQHDLETVDHLGTSPGSPPFVRGGEPGGYVAKPWSICQELSTATPAELNAAALADLQRGQTALGIVLDGPTTRGLDVDQAAKDEVGVGGTSLCCLDDLRQALVEIDLAQTPLHIHAGATALPILAHIVALLEEREAPLESLSGCVGADPLGELALRGNLQIKLDQAFDVMTAVADWASTTTPKLRTVLVRGCPYHDAGASATEELAAAIATGSASLRAMVARGLPVDRAAKQIRFTFSLGTRFFVEIAKLRAARLLWAQVVEAFGGSAEVQRMEIHARTSAWDMSVYDPYVNMLRNTTEAFSAVLGCADSLHVRPFDEPLRPATEFSRRVSRNVQLLLMQESHLTHPADPSGGSWFIEKLTDELARKSWARFQEIESKGGMAGALESGLIQSWLKETLELRAKNLAKRKDVVIGTNKYANLQEKPLEKPEVDMDARARNRVDALLRFRTSTESADEQTSKLEAIVTHEDHCSPDLVRAAIEAVTSGATLGDLSLAICGEGATYGNSEPLEPRRSGDAYAALRRWTEERKAETGASLPVFLANIGALPQYKARADFSTGFFEVGGFDVVNDGGFETAEDAARAALESKAPVVVICSTDAVYPEVVPTFVKNIKNTDSTVTVLLAGRPAKEQTAAYEEAGLDDAIYLGSDCLGLLQTLQSKIGAKDER